ncbi:Gfo/Idh/MocA family protein [Thermogemmatispora tikiterensis]|uniref:Oxidoreductase n=1 Tax=Thermogemmatispora tikiterensis TaxID=1825093 RepID=A0A328VDU9_9CHLR|nr:Gfo/Idh/MocA family oxidoreductase [Thermogemmatispora tikiterensis]RAQ95856.1 oxidoreductase [Thermogemmatispora tikiterensis]
MIGFAIFGAGFIGTVHATNIAAHPRAHLRYIYDVNRRAAEQLAQRLRSTVASSPEEIWSAADVDAVVIASSTNTHATLLSQAIQAGKAVYCEKPVDLEIERVKSVVQEARQSPRPIMIGFSRRFDRNHLAVHEAVQQGEIGKVEMVLLTSRAQEPPPLSYIQVSGGQFRDQTIHFFDLACWLTNEAPVEVYAAGAALVDPAIGDVGDVDTSMLILKMPSGALCHIDNSRRTTYGYDERIEVFGSRGMVQSRLKPLREISLYRDHQVISPGPYPSWFERLEPSFATALDAFIRVLEGQQVVYPTLLDGLRAQLIAEAALLSLRQNVPVKITYWQPA